MADPDIDIARFEARIYPHLDAAYNLARWLTNNDADAQDVLQDACLKALGAFSRFDGDNCKAWLLTIVRNTCYSLLRKKHRQLESAGFDEDQHSAEHNAQHNPGAHHAQPDVLLSRLQDGQTLNAALALLPTEFREILVLRELEGFSYKEIARLIDTPMGTVMSRLSRARDQLREHLLAGAQPDEHREARHGL